MGEQEAKFLTEEQHRLFDLKYQNTTPSCIPTSAVKKFLAAYRTAYATG